ncbi:YVTN beta-propeller repeat-containing protein [Salinisphaera shabanensis T35B1]|nr:c-type cytochrome [Endozoicomonas sp. G2_2]MBO9471477.1 c-type cytochrome [Endozoicomonas sp. G2_2]
MMTKRDFFAGLGLAVALVGLASAAWAYESDEAGANLNAPDYVSEGQYETGRLGEVDQPQPQGFDTGSSYGINGAWPTYVPALADGAGKQKVQAYCSVCHNTTYISMQPPLPSEKWAETVHKMLNTFGAKQYIPSEAGPEIIDYLQAHYTPETIGNNTYSDDTQGGDSAGDSKPNGADKSKTNAADAAVAPADSDSQGAKIYAQNCAACHQANGAGIPGAFPPQAGHTPALLAADGGRDYLAHVLLFGLNGRITIEGKTYNGQMPAWGAALDDADIAKVLNYVLTAWDNNESLPSGFKAYDAAEIATARKTKLSGKDVHNARSELGLDGAGSAESTTSHKQAPSKPSQAQVSLTTAVPEPVYATLQNSSAVQGLGTDRRWSDIGSAHYDAIGPNGRELLVGNIDTGAVYLLDTATGRKRVTFDLGQPTQGVKISPDGTRGLAIVPGAGIAAVFDLKAGKLIKKIKVGKTPHNAKFSADGSTAYVTLQGGGAIATIDMESLQKTGEIPVAGMAQPHNLDLSADGKRLWVRDFIGHVAVVNIASAEVLARIDIGPSHGGIDVVPGGRLVATDAIGGRSVVLINAQTYEKVATIDVGQGPHGVRASADGRWLYVGVTGENKVAVIDLAKHSVVRDIGTDGEFPFWLAVAGNS